MAFCDQSGCDIGNRRHLLLLRVEKVVAWTKTIAAEQTIKELFLVKPGGKGPFLIVPGH